jgi:outer membrane protein assembly factor BamD
MLKKWYWLLLLLPIMGCAGNKVELSLENKAAKANGLFEKKKYARAAELYEDISFEKKSATSTMALMRLAECYFKMNKFTDARLKYTQLTTSYPDYADIQTAYFRIGVCFYEESLPPQLDQTETIQCIEAFRVFVDRFPESPQFTEAIDYIRKAQTKLLSKKYHNGYIYYKMKDYSSALMYFNEISELGNTDELDRKSLYYSIRIHLAQKNTQAANAAWQRLRETYPASKETKRLQKRF